jgi:hypothetical protein
MRPYLRLALQPGDIFSQAWAAISGLAQTYHTCADFFIFFETEAKAEGAQFLAENRAKTYNNRPSPRPHLPTRHRKGHNQPHMCRWSHQHKASCQEVGDWWRGERNDEYNGIVVEFLT